MAHFAEIDENNTVLRVVVVGNDINTSAGPLGENDMHVDGETWCAKFFKTETNTWKQTSYNNNFRKSFAGKGMIYDSVKDKFLLPQPHASWSLDVNDDWQAPIAHPTVLTYNHPSETYSAEDDLPEGKSIGDPKITRYHFISWNEAGQKWTAENEKDESNSHTPSMFDWDVSTLSWVPQ
jgi:hypothetical protein|tara:strand:- start:194 stop:730 length:537 start_codon:yes stop_codon:yes gene_type:complete